MFLRFLCCVGAIPLCGYLMDGVTIIDYGQALLLGAALGVIYMLLRPLARIVLSVVNFCTLGLLYAFVDAWLVWTAAMLMPGGVKIENFWWALAVSVVINALRTLIDAISGRR